jgi:hypothetical protein
MIEEVRGLSASIINDQLSIIIAMPSFLPLP